MELATLKIIDIGGVRWGLSTSGGLGGGPGGVGLGSGERGGGGVKGEDVKIGSVVHDVAKWLSRCC